MHQTQEQTRILDSYMFEIAEDDPAWPELRRRIGDKHTYIGTQFTDKERLEAKWCIIRGVRSIVSYRIPRVDAWSQEYFTSSCEKCGTGWKQIAPFKLRAEPRLGKNHFCSFGGGFELFCVAPVCEEFERMGLKGFESRPVLLGTKGREQVQNLRQIVVGAMAEPSVAEQVAENDRYTRTVCPNCCQTGGCRCAKRL